MSPHTIGAIGVAAMFAMLLLRVPVWIALTFVGFCGNVIMTGPQGALALAGTVPFDVGASYTLSVLPLFILMGEVASETGLSSDLFRAARVMLSGIRSGLAVAALAASACFGAVCGSSVATAATMTRIAHRQTGHSHSPVHGPKCSLVPSRDRANTPPLAADG